VTLFRKTPKPRSDPRRERQKASQSGVAPAAPSQPSFESAPTPTQDRAAGLPANFWNWLFLGLGLVVFTPAFLMEFGFCNDYTFLTPNAYEPWAGFPETRSLLHIGRPVGALLLNLQMLTIHSLTAIKMWRVISFLLASASAAILYGYSRHRLGLKDFWAAALAFGFLTAPPVQVYVLWATNVMPGTFNMFLSLCVYLLLDAAAPDGLRSLFASGRRLLIGGGRAVPSPPVLRHLPAHGAVCLGAYRRPGRVPRPAKLAGLPAHRPAGCLRLSGRGGRLFHPDARRRGAHLRKPAHGVRANARRSALRVWHHA
jgi:hypothetical protein